MIARAAAATAPRKSHPSSPAPGGFGPINWTMVAVIVTALVHLVGVTAWAARADGRISHLEAEVPPGALARIDERTLAIAERVGVIEVSRVRPEERR